MESYCLLSCIFGENVWSATALPPAESEVLFVVSLGGVINRTLLIRMGMWTGVPVAFGLRLLVVSV